jgi:hypothetical protein
MESEKESIHLSQAWVGGSSPLLPPHPASQVGGEEETLMHFQPSGWGLLCPPGSQAQQCDLFPGKDPGLPARLLVL